MGVIDCNVAKRKKLTIEADGRDVVIIANALHTFRNSEDDLSGLCDDCIERLDDMIKETDEVAEQFLEEE